jgi:hypothetical protein
MPESLENYGPCRIVHGRRSGAIGVDRAVLEQVSDFVAVRFARAMLLRFTARLPTGLVAGVHHL